MGTLQPSFGGHPNVMPQAGKSLRDTLANQAFSSFMEQYFLTSAPDPNFATGKYKGSPPLKEMTSYKGEPVILFKDEEISTLAAPFQFYLVWKFMGIRSSMEFLRKGFGTIGFSEEFQLGFLAVQHVLIWFSQQSDYHHCWMHEFWRFKHHTMKVLKWTPDLSFDREPPIVPVWISFGKLPIHFFQKHHLLSLAALLGKPLKIDVATINLTRPSVARVCVELNQNNPLPKRIWIGQGKSGFWQTVLYKDLPEYYVDCCYLGHVSGHCESVSVLPNCKTQVWRLKASHAVRTTGSHQPVSVPNQFGSKDVIHTKSGSAEKERDLQSHPNSSGHSQKEQVVMNVVSTPTEVSGVLAQLNQDIAQEVSAAAKEKVSTSAKEVSATAAQEDSAEQITVDGLRAQNEIVTSAQKEAEIGEPIVAPVIMPLQVSSTSQVGGNTNMVSASNNNVQQCSDPAVGVVIGDQLLELAIIPYMSSSPCQGQVNLEESHFLDTSAVPLVDSSRQSQHEVQEEFLKSKQDEGQNYDDDDEDDEDETDEHDYEDLTDGSEGTHAKKRLEKRKLKGIPYNNVLTPDDLKDQSKILGLRIRKRERPPGSRNHT